jgi:hypothetical protein
VLFHVIGKIEQFAQAFDDLILPLQRKAERVPV